MKTAVEWLKEIYDSCNTYEKFISNSDWEEANKMDKEQSECICVNVIDRILSESEQGKKINSKQIFEDVYNETFKSE